MAFQPGGYAYFSIESLIFMFEKIFIQSENNKITETFYLFI